MQQARALQQSEALAGYRQRRVVVEHRLSRLEQLGIRQARYFGRAKTRFELYLAATVANLTLVAGNAGIAGETGAAPSVGNELATGIANSASMTEAKWAGQLQTLILLASYSLPKFLYPTRGFRPSF